MKIRFSIFDLLAATTTLGVYLALRQMILSSSSPLRLFTAVMSTLILTIVMFRRPRQPRHFVYWIGIGSGSAMLSYTVLAIEVTIRYVMITGHFSWKAELLIYVPFCLEQGFLGGALGMGAGIIAKFLPMSQQDNEKVDTEA